MTHLFWLVSSNVTHVVIRQSGPLNSDVIEKCAVRITWLYQRFARHLCGHLGGKTVAFVYREIQGFQCLCTLSYLPEWRGIGNIEKKKKSQLNLIHTRKVSYRCHFQPPEIYVKSH